MTPEQKKRQVLEFLLDFLGDAYVKLNLGEFYIKSIGSQYIFESPLCDQGYSRNIVSTQPQNTVVEACADALISSLSGEYPTLCNLTFDASRMSVKPKKSLMIAEVGVIASTRRVVYFSFTSRSALESIVSCVLEVVEYFLNAERAFLKLKPLVIEARSRNRSDLVQKYQVFMSKLVEVNNYERLSL